MTTYVVFTRIEPVDFILMEVQYLIDGYVSRCTRATREQPAEGGEAFITFVHRVHPVLHEQDYIEAEFWPFTAFELALIKNDMYSQAGAVGYSLDHNDY